MEIQKSAVVIDTHADTPPRFLDENYDIGCRTIEAYQHNLWEHPCELYCIYFS
jgi:hypothetical protein